MARKSVLQRRKSGVPTKGTLAVIGEIEVRTVGNDYHEVSVPLHYVSDTGKRDLFTAHFLLRPEWLTARFARRAREGKVDHAEKVQFDINVRGYLKGLFASAGIKTGRLSFGMLAGRAVGFVPGDDGDRVSYFFSPIAN